MNRFLGLATAALVLSLLSGGNPKAATLPHQPDISKLAPIELNFTTMSAGIIHKPICWH